MEVTVLNATGGLWVSVPMRCCWGPHPFTLSLSLKHTPRSSIFRYSCGLILAPGTWLFPTVRRGVTEVCIEPLQCVFNLQINKMSLCHLWKFTFNRFVSPQDYFEFPSSGPEISEKARSLITGLISEREDRLGRKGFSDFRGHPFFSGLDWASLHELPAPFLPEVSNPTDTSNFDVMDDCLTEMVFLSQCCDHHTQSVSKRKLTGVCCCAGDTV